MTADERKWQRDQAVKYALKRLENPAYTVKEALTTIWDDAFTLGYNDGCDDCY